MKKLVNGRYSKFFVDEDEECSTLLMSGIVSSVSESLYHKSRFVFGNVKTGKIDKARFIIKSMEPELVNLLENLRDLKEALEDE